jgi:alkanesulfonate monooxygenase SsuD/methylene tetrahydromethanopterin reductase-like flavin-dependent oxidoreductase (luciferase family)
MGSIGQRPLNVGLFLTAFDQPWANAPAPGWSELVARTKRAEEIGFDSVWVPDHLLIQDDGERLGVWEGWSLLAALAAAIDRIELGSLVACTAFRNPALLAKMADTVDEISGGRLTLGLGAGWHEPEFQAFGYPFDHRVSRFEEAVTIIHGLLKHGKIDFEGTYYQARDCELRPRAAGPPIMIGASGARVLGLTARFADVWNRDFDKVNPDLEPFSPEDLAVWQLRVDAACFEVGRDPATLERTAAVLVDLPNAPGREGWNALTGPPEDLAEGLRSYASAGFTHVQIWLQPATIAGIEAFAPVLDLLNGG